MLLFNLSVPKTFLNVFALPTIACERYFLGYITVEFCPIEDELRIEVPCTLLSLIEAPRFLPAISSTTVIIEGYKGIYKVSCMSEHWLQLCFEICTECVEVIPKLEFPIQ